MDKIWNRKSFEVGGHWPLWRGWKNRMTTQKSRTVKKRIKIWMLKYSCVWWPWMGKNEWGGSLWCGCVFCRFIHIN